jgi:hypothetical protein
MLMNKEGIERTHHHVSENLVVVHLDVSNGDGQAEHFLQLELDGRTYLGELIAQVFGMRDRRREFTGLGQTGPEQARNLLEESF